MHALVPGSVRDQIPDYIKGIICFPGWPGIASSSNNVELGIFSTPNATKSNESTELIDQFHLKIMDYKADKIIDARSFAHYFNVIN